MRERKQKIDVSDLLPLDRKPPLRKPLSAQEISAGSYKEFFDKLTKARERERTETNKSNTSGD